MSEAELSIGSGRLRSIDALRGIAALGVLLFHALGGLQNSIVGLTHILGTIIAIPLSFGYTGVTLFFVISGFCIHLRWAKAKAAGKSTKIDFIAFWKRRVFRLYPPYLIALASYLFVLMLEGQLDLTRFFAFDLGVHVLMLHNVMSETAYSFNGAFWTLAIEEQLYLAYFLLLFLRNRLGWKRTLAICLGARVLWYVMGVGLNPLLPSLFSEPFFYQSHSFYFQIPVNAGAMFHWFTWALGALAVEGAVGIVKLPAWSRNLKLGFITLFLAAVLAYIDRTANPDGVFHQVVWLIIDPIWGLGFFCIVNRAVAKERAWRSTLSVPRIIAIFAGVGIFSYSLYLMHDLILIHFRHTIARWFGVPDYGVILFSLLALSPLCVGFSWVFFQLFEKPFIAKPVNISTELSDEDARALRRIRFSLILRRAAIISLALIVLAELGLRIYDRINPLSVFQDDSYNRFRGRPFAPDYAFRLNSSGLKDLEFRQKKDDDTFRILGIGNSFAYGVVPYQYSYLTILEDSLNKSERRFEVINMGIPKICLKDYLAILIREGLELKPDLVVVSFSIGDDLSGHKEEAKVESYLAIYLSSKDNDYKKYEGQVYNETPVYDDNQPTLAPFAYLKEAHGRSLIYRQLKDAFKQDVADAVDYLAKMKRICDDRKISFTVVVIPDEAQINKSLQDQIIGASNATPDEFDFTLPNRLLTARLSARNIDHLDLLDEFARASNQMNLYKPNDGHWNIAGNKLAAEILQRHLSSIGSTKAD